MARFHEMHIYDGSPRRRANKSKSLVVNVLLLSTELVDLIREGYSQDSFYGDEGEWTKDNHAKATSWYFWRLDRPCVPRKSELRLRFIS
jgi:hypothetical protein